MNLSSRVFRILNHRDNAGKMERFFEALNIFKAEGMAIMAMTDADMVHP